MSSHTKSKRDSEKWFVNRFAIVADTEQRIALSMRRAYILPTQKGVYYAVTLAVMFIWAINYALSLGYAVTFFVAIFAVLIMVMTVMNLSGVTVAARDSVGNHQPFYAGDAAYFRLFLENDQADAAINFQARRNGVLGPLVSVENNNHGIVQVPIDDVSRGIKYLDVVRLSSDYPMGIFRAWTWLRFDSSVIIYPQPRGTLPLPFRPEHRDIDSGISDSEGADDFAGLRPYRPGDNVRHVVWKKSALGEVTVKTFESLSGQECVLDFNDPELTELDLESRLSQMCAWVLEAERLGIAYKLILPNKTLVTGMGASHRARCLEELACY